MVTSQDLRWLWWLMRSVSFYARMVREVDKPRQNKMLSIMLLLPEPLGPEMVVKPFSKGITVLPEKDLKLSMTISQMCMQRPRKRG